MRSVPASPAPGHGSTDESLAVLAHELRDPLATILFALDVVQYDSDCGPATRQALGIAEHQARRAARLVDDLFGLCAAPLGGLALCKEVVELAAVVARAAEAVGHRLAAAGHRLTVTLPPGPVFLTADSLRLEQVLTNLLGNAAKFTGPGGHIRLTAEAGPGEVVLRVQDDGPGIDPDLLPRVFDLFYRAPGPARQTVGGLGVGLALVKSLVELHGGAVAAHSEGPGTGCEFVVRLPATTRGD